MRLLCLAGSDTCRVEEKTCFCFVRPPRSHYPDRGLSLHVCPGLNCGAVDYEMTPLLSDLSCVCAVQGSTVQCKD